MELAHLKERYNIAQQALHSFDESINLMRQYEKKFQAQKTEHNELEYRAHRDSVIKRFEFTLDTSWKYLKFFLEAHVGIIQNSPKPVIRECFKNGFISEQQATAALDMVDARNISSHIYHDEVAEQIWGKIPQYYFLLKTFLDTLPPHIEKLN